jgi:hypothetical protein
VGIAVLVLLVALFLYLDWRIYVQWPWKRKHKRHNELISIIIPFQSFDPVRLRIFEWVLQYWHDHLPEAEIIVAGNDEIPFHKTLAVNEGVQRARGDILVIMDGDCYMSADTVREVANRIRQARRENRKLWYVPYRRFYRLNERASEALLHTHPQDPLRIPDPPPSNWVEHMETSSSGHWWGALIQVMPREAFIEAGGMDIRFQGWGGEDVSFMHAVDTVWSRHKTFDGPVFHIWHPVIPGRWKHTRQWPGQPTAEMNDQLSSRYVDAIGDEALMRRVITEE